MTERSTTESATATELATIRLSGLTARGYHGVLEHERRDGQDFVVDVELEVDAGRAVESDDLRDTVDYAWVSGIVVDHITGAPFNLIETLAHRIVARILSDSAASPVQAVSVTVHKPEAPIAATFSDVTVTVRQGRRK